MAPLVVDAFPKVDRAARERSQDTRGDAERDAAAAFAVPAPLAQEIAVLAEARDADVARGDRPQTCQHRFHERVLVGGAGLAQQFLEKELERGDADLELARVVEVADLRHPQGVAPQNPVTARQRRVMEEEFRRLDREEVPHGEIARRKEHVVGFDHGGAAARNEPGSGSLNSSSLSL